MYDYNKIEPGYYDKVFAGGGPQGQWHRDKFKEVLRIISQSQYKNILDVGCSAGTFLRLVREKYLSADLTGIDYSESQIKVAQNLSDGTINFFSSDATDFLEGKEGVYDIITMIEMVEHFDFKYNSKLLKSAFLSLKKNGRIIITTPNYYSLWPVLELIVNKISPLSYGEQHISKFDKNSLSKTITMALQGKDFIFDVRRFQGFAPFLWFLSDNVREILVNFETRDFWLGHLLIVEIKRAK